MLLPMEPLWAGSVFKGKLMRLAYQGMRRSHFQEAVVQACQCANPKCVSEQSSFLEGMPPTKQTLNLTSRGTYFEFQNIFESR